MRHPRGSAERARRPAGRPVARQLLIGGAGSEPDRCDRRSATRARAVTAAEKLGHFTRPPSVGTRVATGLGPGCARVFRQRVKTRRAFNDTIKSDEASLSGQGSCVYLPHTDYTDANHLDARSRTSDAFDQRYVPRPRSPFPFFFVFLILQQFYSL